MKRVKKKKKIARRIIPAPIYTSPDGGETVYLQNKDGTRGKLVSKTQYAKDAETVQDEEEMINEEAVKMRRKYPALGKAWKHYKTVWHLIMGQK